MAKKIAVFNHKGGVSKTTSIYHIAWKMSQTGKKVLLVDADSQCNLTILILGEEGYENHYSNHPNSNLKDGLKPVFKAQTSVMKPVDCLVVKDNPNLFLLPGHLDLGEYEIELAFSFLNSFGVMKNLPGAFNSLLDKIADRYGIDYIFIDMNPSLSAINQNIILTSDFFIVPTSPDYFSSMAINSLSTILPKWENWAKGARPNFSDAVYPMTKHTPKFLGYTVNDFSIRKNNPTAAFQGMINNIDTTVSERFAPNLKAADMLLPEEAYEETYCLGQIHDFGSVIAKTQEHGLPIFVLSDKQIGQSGIVLETSKKNIEVISQEFDKILNKIISRSN